MDLILLPHAPNTVDTNLRVCFKRMSACADVMAARLLARSKSWRSQKLLAN
jgi:hypothetical protein